MDRRLGIFVGTLVCGLSFAVQLNADEVDPQVVSVLRNWESTSQERDRDGLSVRTLQPFLGPIREDSLLRRFVWSVRSDSELEATPADPAERLFSPGVRIVIDSRGLPRQVVIGQLPYEVRDLARAEMLQVSARESASNGNVIVRVSFNENAEASPPPGINQRVLQVISRWVAASKAAQALRTDFVRIDYDSAIEVESHAAGTFVYRAPHHGLYHSHPTSIPSTESARIGLDGRQYVQLAGEEMMLFWEENSLTQVDYPGQQYVVYERPGTPREVLGAGSFDAVWQTLIAPQSALPMVVGLDQKELVENFEWELVTDDKHSILLRGVPINGPDAMLYSSAQVLLDPVTFRTRATRIIDAAGTKETIHRFKDQIVSMDVAALGDWIPNLSQFKAAPEVPGVEPATFVEGDQPASPLIPGE